VRDAPRETDEVIRLTRTVPLVVTPGGHPRRGRPPTARSRVQEGRSGSAPLASLVATPGRRAPRGRGLPSARSYLPDEAISLSAPLASLVATPGRRAPAPRRPAPEGTHPALRTLQLATRPCRWPRRKGRTPRAGARRWRHRRARHAPADRSMAASPQRFVGGDTGGAPHRSGWRGGRTRGPLDGGFTAALRWWRHQRGTAPERLARGTHPAFSLARLAAHRRRWRHPRHLPWRKVGRHRACRRGWRHLPTQGSGRRRSNPGSKRGRRIRQPALFGTQRTPRSEGSSSGGDTGGAVWRPVDFQLGITREQMVARVRGRTLKAR